MKGKIVPCSGHFHLYRLLLRSDNALSHTGALGQRAPTPFAVQSVLTKGGR
jgi:hypothetical protein